MKLFQLSLALGLVVHRGAARVVPGDGTSGREVYNTFLGKGRKHDAVNLRGSKTQRDLSEALNNNTIADLMFKFTEPTANLTGLNLTEYFVPVDPDSALDRALADQDEAEEDEAGQEVTAQFKRDKGSTCLVETKINTIETNDFNSYLRAMGIEASTAVSGYGQEASVSGSYLDKAEMARNTLTYLTIVNVDQQVQLPGDYVFNLENYDSETFAPSHGNRVKTALSYLGVSGSLSASVKNSMDEVQKNSNMEISVFYQGAVGNAMNGGSGDKIEGTSAETALLEVKSKVNAFLAIACEHKYKYKPLLDRYEHLANFPPEQDVISYHQAESIAQIVLEQLIRCSEMRTALKRMKYIDSDTKQAIEFDYADVTHHAREWTKATARDPTNPRQTAQQLLALINEKFVNKYLNLFEPKDYISGITVKYGRDRPDENVHEVNGRGDDLNKDFGGEYSYLVATTTRDPERACTHFLFKKAEYNLNEKYPNIWPTDISKGDGRKWFRHLTCYAKEDHAKITKVALLRSENGYKDYISKYENGFLNGSGTSNINEGRGSSADALYLIWAS
ncbi:hypothetical protein MY4824_002286 [Beauveria thailandica]